MMIQIMVSFLIHRISYNQGNVRNLLQSRLVITIDLQIIYIEGKDIYVSLICPRKIVDLSEIPILFRSVANRERGKGLVRASAS